MVPRPFEFCCLIAFAVMAVCVDAYGLSPAQQKLMREQTEELVQIRKQIMQQLVKTNQLKDGTVYVKVKVREQPDKKFTYTVEKVSTEKPSETTDKKKGIIFLKGDVVSDKVSDKRFKLDLKYLMPPEKNVAVANSQNNKKGHNSNK